MSELTFRHFIDRPKWAAAAGYNFNFIDCLSFCATIIEPWNGVKECSSAIPDIELREIYLLPVYLAAIAFCTLWPLIFWVMAPAVWVKCKSHQKKYKGSKSEIVEKNLAAWKRKVDKREGVNG